MIYINIRNFGDNIYNLLENVIKYNELIKISTKNGNAVVMSEEDYNNMMEIVHFTSMTNLKNEIVRRANENDEEYIDESIVKW